MNVCTFTNFRSVVALYSVMYMMTQIRHTEHTDSFVDSSMNLMI